MGPPGFESSDLHEHQHPWPLLPDLTRYLFLDGRPGTANNPVISSTSTGSVFGSGATNLGLELWANNVGSSTLGTVKVRAQLVVLEELANSAGIELRLMDVGSVHYTGLQTSPIGATTSITYTFPQAAPALNGALLTTLTGGLWSWATAAMTAADTLTMSPTIDGNIVGSSTTAKKLILKGNSADASGGEIDLFASPILLDNAGTASELRFREPSGGGSNYTAFKAGALAQNTTYVLPTTDPTSGQVLTSTAPVAGVATLSWGAAGGASGPMGPVGFSGEDGEDAMWGPQGPMGVPGSNGATGAQGPIGTPVVFIDDSPDNVWEDGTFRTLVAADLLNLNDTIKLWPTLGTPPANSDTRLLAFNNTITKSGASNAWHLIDMSPTLTWSTAGADYAILYHVPTITNTVAPTIYQFTLFKSIPIFRSQTNGVKPFLPDTIWDGTNMALEAGAATESNFVAVTVLNQHLFNANGGDYTLSGNNTGAGRPNETCVFWEPSFYARGTSTLTFSGAAVAVYARTPITFKDAGATLALTGRVAGIYCEDLLASSAANFSTGSSLFSRGSAVSIINAGPVRIGDLTDPTEKLEVLGNILLVSNGATPGELRFMEPSSTQYTAFKAQTQTANVTYTLPAADGSGGNVLSTDGSGTLSWAAGGASLTRISGNSGAAGSDLTVQILTGTSSSVTTVALSSSLMTTTGVGVGTWKAKYSLIFQSTAAATGVGFGVNHTGTSTYFKALLWCVTTGGTAATGVPTDVSATSAGQMAEGKTGTAVNTIIGSVFTGVANANTDTMAILEVIVVVSVTGSLELKISTETAGTGVTLRANTMLELVKIA